MPLLMLDESLPSSINDNNREIFPYFRKRGEDRFDEMVFPVEIIEQILLKCDGQTLLNCRDVNCTFRKIVDYLVQVGFINKRLHR